MSENPYFAYTREELKDEIRVEREQREGLRREISQMRTEIRQLQPLTRGYWQINGQSYPNEAVALTQRHVYGSGARALGWNTYNSRMRRLGFAPGETLEVYRAVKYAPSRLTPVSEVTEAPERALREAEISRLEREIEKVDAELEKKKEAWDKPEKLFRLWERTRYYKYTSKDRRNRRHFEVKAAMHFPAGWNEGDMLKVEGDVSRLFDMILDDAYGPDIFDIPFNDIGWATGWEAAVEVEEVTRKTERVVGEVDDKAEHYYRALANGEADWTIPSTG